MPRSMLVRQVMTPLDRVLSFTADVPIEAAARKMAERSIGGAPVVDADGLLVGMLRDDDLIVSDARLHMPTVISVLGAYIELPSSQHRFEEELRKAAGATVGDVMTSDARTCREDDSLETVATVLHEDNLSRLPVVDADGRLQGIVARGDLVRAFVGDQSG